MPSQIRNRRRLPEQLRQAGQPVPAGLDCAISLVVPARDVSGRRTGLADHRRVPHPVEIVTIREEPEEVLIADARGTLTPTQMVERKLLYLLRNAGQGISVQRTADPFALQRHARGSGNPELPVGVPPPCNKTR